MKRLDSSLLRAVCAWIIGLLLVLFPSRAGDYFVLTIGVVFMIPSIVVLLRYWRYGHQMHLRFPLEAVGGLLFGLWLFVSPTFFAHLLTLILGLLLVTAGIHQIFSLQAARRWTTVPLPFYLLPVLILLAGLVALFNPIGVQRTLFILIGISCLCYAVSEFMNWFRFLRHRPSAGPLRENMIEDAEIVE
ncbi:MAG: DUF308 domain-containing protein [Bacteroides sp.]|nr:DUF308 domain-containing protein [Bacteroides sp.]